MNPAEREHHGRLRYVTLGSLGLDVAPAAMPPGSHALHAWLKDVTS
jgi:hypothetical protein